MNTIFRGLTRWKLVAGIAVVGVVGCGVNASREASREPRASYAAVPSSTSAQALGMRAKGINDAYSTALQIGDAAAEAGAEGATPAVDRKIIYEAQLNLVVDDLAETETAINKLLAQCGGYAAESGVARQQGEQLSGTWRVRVPIVKYGEFLDAVAALGVAETRQQTAQDVTEEFVDLTARISNKKRLEERIVELLGSAADKITDVLQVEQELARVRGEIEQMEGRLRYLSNRTELTTVSIVAREEHDYVPPAAPTFASRIATAWQDSLLSLRSFGEDLGIAIVAAAPWVAIFAVVVMPLAWVVRKRAARRRLAGNVRAAG